MSRVDPVPGYGGAGGDEEGSGRVPAGAARPLPPRPLPDHHQVLAGGHEQEAGLLRAQKGENHTQCLEKARIWAFAT